MAVTVHGEEEESADVPWPPLRGTAVHDHGTAMTTMST